MQANKGWISEILNEASMSRLGEAWDSHTQQAEVRNQLLWTSASTRKETVLSDPQPGWDTYRITPAKYPLDILGKATKVTSI